MECAYRPLSCRQSLTRLSFSPNFHHQASPDRMSYHMQDVTDSVFYTEFGHIMWSAPVVGLEFTRYLPIVIVPYALLQARFHT